MPVYTVLCLTTEEKNGKLGSAWPNSFRHAAPACAPYTGQPVLTRRASVSPRSAQVPSKLPS
jgi:hypothetical protein